MINPQELRIGNIVKEKGFGTQEITELSEHGYNGFNSYNERVTFYYSDIEGIPLTEEWLLKLDLRKTKTVVCAMNTLIQIVSFILLKTLFKWQRGMQQYLIISI